MNDFAIVRSKNRREGGEIVPCLGFIRVVADPVLALTLTPSLWGSTMTIRSLPGVVQTAPLALQLQSLTGPWKTT